MRENRAKTGRDDDGRFKEGVSGNPAGRPKIENLSALREALQLHVPRAIEVLRELIDDDKAAPSTRLAASQAILDRCFGKPAQTITQAEDEGNSWEALFRKAKEYKARSDQEVAV